MKKILVMMLIVGFLTFFSMGNLFAATDSDAHDVTIQISEVILMELNSTATITLSIVSPGAGNAGLAVTGSNDTSKELFYTSLNSAATTRTITAQLGAAMVVTGVDLTLVAVATAAAGGGTAQPKVTLNDGLGHVIVNGIGSCATTRGVGAGTTLTYALENIVVGSLVVGGGETVTVTLTISDAA